MACACCAPAANRDIVRPVKKYLLILLMLILPVQYAWSAAAVYCQHEQGAPSHFGHHAHAHKASPDDHGHPKVKSLDTDCEYCHMFSHAFFVPFDARPTVHVALNHAVPATLSYTSHIPRRPPRPNWLLVA